MNKSRIVIRVFALTLITSLSSVAQAKRQRLERDYQADWCEYSTEVRLSDKTRVDCLTPEYAIEFDFANKWAECVGQSLHYAAMTGRLPGCVLIIEKKEQCRYVARLKSAISELVNDKNQWRDNFKYWLIGAGAPACDQD